MSKEDPSWDDLPHSATQLRTVVPDLAANISLRTDQQAVAIVINAFDEAGIDTCATDFERHIPQIGNTLTHQNDVAKLAHQIGEAYPDAPSVFPNALTARDRTVLYFAAKYHDIGKLNCDLPDLYVKGRYNEKQYEKMKLHPQFSYQILRTKSVAFFNDQIGRVAREDGIILTPFASNDPRAAQDIATVALHHHEHFDGTGYPHHKAGTSIPLLSRIIAVADVFDAHISERCYKGKLPVDHALREMIPQAGKYFDPFALDMLLHLKATQDVRATLMPTVKGTGAIVMIQNTAQWPSNATSETPHKPLAYATRIKWPAQRATPN